MAIINWSKHNILELVWIQILKISDFAHHIVLTSCLDKQFRTLSPWWEKRRKKKGEKWFHSFVVPTEGSFWISVTLKKDKIEAFKDKEDGLYHCIAIQT